MTNYLEDDNIFMDVSHALDFATEVAKFKRDIVKVSRIVAKNQHGDAEDVAAALEDAGFEEDDFNPKEEYYHFTTSYGGVQIIGNKVNVYIDTGTDMYITCYVGKI